MRRMLKSFLPFACVLLLLTGCTSVIGGRPMASGTNPLEVAGKPVTDGPSGLRPNAPGPLREVQNGDGGEIDRLVLYSIADIEEFWRSAYGEPLPGTFTPVDALFSYDSRFKHGETCGDPTEDNLNLSFCYGEEAKNCSATQCSSAFNTIVWDRGVFVPQDRELFGDMMIPLDIGHEYGHAIAYQAGMLNPKSYADVLVGEQQADCFSGLYLRWVSDGHSPRFTLSTGEDLNKLLASQIAVRDALLGEDDPSLPANAHGSAFERVTAFQMGFEPDALARCAGIDVADVERRRGDLPPELLERGQTGEYPVTRESMTHLLDALNEVFTPEHPPTLDVDAPNCADGGVSQPAYYCPSTNTIVADLDRLVVMGSSLTRGSPYADDYGGPLFGDYSAYSVVVSRYVLALQDQRGNVRLDGLDAAMRTACLTGLATKRLSAKTVDFQVYGGDLDEAVAGVLTNGFAASDVDGAPVPSGFARVNAFRSGVLGSTEDNCYSQWP